MKIHLLYFNIGYLCFGFLKKLQQELPKNMLLSFSNKFFFHKFIYKSILSMILLKMYKWYWVLYIQKEDFLWWNISSLHCK